MGDCILNRNCLDLTYIKIKKIYCGSCVMSSMLILLIVFQLCFTPFVTPTSYGIAAFSKFENLVDKADIGKVLEEAGNVTIFTPFNAAFDKLPAKVDDLPLPTVRKMALKHFIKGYLPKEDIKSGKIQTLGGEFVEIIKNVATNQLKILSQSTISNVKISGIKTKFGLVYLIDNVLL